MKDHPAGVAVLVEVLAQAVVKRVALGDFRAFQVFTIGPGVERGQERRGLGGHARRHGAAVGHELQHEVVFGGPGLDGRAHAGRRVESVSPP